jgi:hypothetical protein
MPGSAERFRSCHGPTVDNTPVTAIPTRGFRALAFDNQWLEVGLPQRAGVPDKATALARIARNRGRRRCPKDTLR